MGCATSGTAVRPLRGDEDETGSKHGDRGDSAVSKVTADSGVVVEHREAPALPGEVPGQLPALALVRHGEADRKKSCEILEELLNQGIIPVNQTREGGGRGGEAYSIMLDDRQGVQRRPARLESLKAQKESRLPSREEIEEKIRLAEERRKSREEEFKTRLRAKSARRVRGPAPTSNGEDQDAAPAATPTEPDPTPAPPLHSRVTRGEAESGKEPAAAGKKGGIDEAGESRDHSRERKGGAEKISEGGDGEQQEAAAAEEEEEEEEELTQVEELRAGQLLSASGELESDSSFQRAEDKEEVF